jgi:hypothetical protein
LDIVDGQRRIHYRGARKMTMPQEVEHAEPKRRGRPLGSRNRENHRAGRPKGGGKPKETFDEALWQNGRRRISVEDTHIAESLQRSSSACAIAEALKQQIPHAIHVSVDLATIRWTDSSKQLRYTALTPACAQQLVVDFDQGLREKLSPISFDLKPVIIARSGARRRQVPEASDLRGTGISPAAPSPEEKALADNWHPQPQADRNGALVEPVEKQKRQPRMARTVSRAKPSGEVPVVLGGRMPPISALPSNQRAFGLRQARR